MPAAGAVRPIAHEDRLTLVEHLDELRSRLIICLGALIVVYALCLWQNDALLDILNRPLSNSTQAAINKGKGLPGQIDRNRQATLALGQATLTLSEVLVAPASGLSAAARARIARSAAEVRKTISALPKQTQGAKPVTLRVGEPFSTTLTVSLYFALLFTGPLLLYELYGFVLPAFTPRERRVAVPLMAMVPFLFIAGVVFGYFVVLPPAVRFLQNFNTDQFNVLVQASDYYKFAVLALLGLGILFQMPVGILAATKMGIVTPRQLRHNRRYALLIIAVVAMLLPGTDPITMLISMVPLLLLYEASILLAVFFGRPAAPEEDLLEDEPVSEHEEEPLYVPVGGEWDGGHDHDDDGWDEPPPRRDGPGEGDVS